MNLYKIKFLHAAPKDVAEGIKCFLLAKNDEQVYDWIKSEPEINGKKLFNCWDDYGKIGYSKTFECFTDEDGNESDESGWYDENGDPELFKPRMLRLKGEMNDDDYDFADAYYGITLYGWELIKEDIKIVYSELIDMGIVHSVLST